MPIRVVATPAKDAGGYEQGGDGQGAEREGYGDPSGRGRDAIFKGAWSFGGFVAVGEVIFGEEIFFVEAEVAGDGADEAAVENAARQLVPIFIFEGFEKAQADAGSDNDFVGRDFAQFAFALETFSEVSPGHGSNPVRQTGEKVSAAGWKSARCGAPSRKV